MQKPVKKLHGLGRRHGRRRDAARGGPSPGRFWAPFALFLLAFQLLFYTAVDGSATLRGYLAWTARLAGLLPELGGQDVRVAGQVLTSARTAVHVGKGCGGPQSCAIFAAGVLAFPSPPAVRLRGLLAGLCLLPVLNVLRVVGLFLLGPVCGRCAGNLPQEPEVGPGAVSVARQAGSSRRRPRDSAPGRGGEPRPGAGRAPRVRFRSAHAA